MHGIVIGILLEIQVHGTVVHTESRLCIKHVNLVMNYTEKAELSVKIDSRGKSKQTRNRPRNLTKST